MKTILKLTADKYDQLIAHLLPAHSSYEQAAFLFATSERKGQDASFNVIEVNPLAASAFDYQSEDCLQLSDHTRVALIKRAHALGSSLVEVHSHPAPFGAAFSTTDLLGLSETVPHMWWRLKQKPYIALVIAATGFDALVWVESPEKPQALDCIVAGDRILRPTNHTIGSRR